MNTQRLSSSFRPLFNTSQSVSLETRVRGHLFGPGPKSQELVCLRCAHVRRVDVADITPCHGTLIGALALLPEQPLLDEAA